SALRGSSVSPSPNSPCTVPAAPSQRCPHRDSPGSKFTAADFRQTAVAVFFVAWPTRKENHRFVLPVRSNFRKADFVHVVGEPCVAMAFQSDAATTRRDLAHAFVRDVFPDGRDEILPDLGAEMKAAPLADN